MIVPTFTFHHVSIKTLVEQKDIVEQIKFTFHHVSIKTSGEGDTTNTVNSFTFHHVSIKTELQQGLTAAWIYIHIPPCIY